MIGAVAFFFMINNFTFRAGADPVKLFEGDIVLPKYELDNLEAFLNGTLYTVFTRNAVKNAHELWPGGVVPYTFSTDEEVSEEARKVIFEAMKVYEEKTCIRFKPLEAEDSHIRFIGGGGCYSYVGKMSWGGAQEVSIGSGCEILGTVLHELMHAVGFYHEQSRADRDEYVRINKDNIQPGKEGNFKKHDLTVIKHLGEEYDYCSIMHYGAFFFSKDWESPTIVPIKETECTIGQARDFSVTDLRKINKLYECGGGQEITTTEPIITMGPIITTEPVITMGPIITTEPIITMGPIITTEPTETCQDYDEWCEWYAENEFCQDQELVEYMRENCAKSCDPSCGATPPEKCKNKKKNCNRRAMKGHCTSSNQRKKRFMKKNCKRACGFC